MFLDSACVKTEIISFSLFLAVKSKLIFILFHFIETMHISQIPSI